MKSTPYTDRSVAAWKGTRKAAFKAVTKDYLAAKKACEQMRDGGIKAANAFRSAGIRLQSLCNHQRLNEQFWENNDCANQLPFSFDVANDIIGIANKLPDEVKTIEEAAPLTQMMFQTGGFLQISHREEQQIAAPIPLTQIFIGRFSQIREMFAKVERTVPMKDWNRSTLNDFLEDTEWIDKERSKARLLMSGK